MKNYILLGFVLLNFAAKAQEIEKVSVEENLYGVQLGFINTGFYYETKLQRKITLRTEAGLEFVTSTRDYIDPAVKDETAILISPFIALEPRWYYGLDRRTRLKKNTLHNSSNFLSLRTSYTFNDIPLINTKDFNVVSSIMIVPKFGIRRVFAKHFNYEFSGGLGYQYNVFSKEKGCNCDHSDVAVDLQVRIGYDF